MSDGGENKKRKQVVKRKNSDSSRSAEGYEKKFNNSNNSIDIPNDLDDQIDEEIKSIVRTAQKYGVSEKYQKLCTEITSQKIPEEKILDQLDQLHFKLNNSKC